MKYGRHRADPRRRPTPRPTHMRCSSRLGVPRVECRPLPREPREGAAADDLPPSVPLVRRHQLPSRRPNLGSPSTGNSGTPRVAQSSKLLDVPLAPSLMRTMTLRATSTVSFVLSVITERLATVLAKREPNGSGVAVAVQAC